MEKIILSSDNLENTLGLHLEIEKPQTVDINAGVISIRRLVETGKLLLHRRLEYPKSRNCTADLGLIE